MSDFTDFNRLIPSAAEQLEKLQLFNERDWDGQMTAALRKFQLPALRRQSVEDAQVLLADFGSTQETFRQWTATIKREYPAYFQWKKMKTDPKHLQLGKLAVTYPAGIHAVRINLVANWSPNQWREPERVFKEAKQQHWRLAQAEILAAVALMPDLVKRQRSGMPKWDMLGYKVHSPDQSTSAQGVLCIGWEPDHHPPRIEWSIRLRDFPAGIWGIPTIIG